MVLEPDWKKCETLAEKMYDIMHSDKNGITFFEIDCVLNLIQTQCTTQKYLYVLEKAGSSDIHHPDLNHAISESGKSMYG